MFSRELTGWHVAAIFGGAFAVIIGVNLTLAFKAVSTFPGLETRNSYVASQTFDRDRATQEALGWNVSADLVDGMLFLRIDDEVGAVVPRVTAATLGRATHVADDLSPVFRHDGTRFVAEVGTLARGNWNLRVEAEAADGTAFRQRVIVRVAP
ncbi:FixH family protein [uncultured Tateyamaria sp.]|uniref:FixH family protein n=1 Tax=uncultured Tateyamaria sp. TaxID=455651 RepID=UPI00261E8C26|nr:FixH family protein [uncultured Tateyamaria sp.]